MPFDEFFSSKNKHHYVRSEKYETEVDPEVERILALSEVERCKIMAELRVKASHNETSMTEKFVLRKLQYIWKCKHRAIQKCVYWKRQAALRKKGAAFFTGYNTT